MFTTTSGTQIESKLVYRPISRVATPASGIVGDDTNASIGQTNKITYLYR